LHAHSFYLAL